MRRLAFVLLTVLTISLTVSFGFAQKGPLTVGSKIDTEGSVLAQVIRLMLEQNDFTVDDRSGFGYHFGGA